MMRGRFAIIGMGASGIAAAEVLTTLGATVRGFDAHGDAIERAYRDLGIDGYAAADPQVLADAVIAWSPSTIIVSPGIPSHAPVYQRAAAAGIPVWSEVELAWQVRSGGKNRTAAPWLTLSGTNGKTTTVTMLETILRANGDDALAVGNVGEPIVRTAAEGGASVLAVELSSFQLHSTWSVQPLASACLNIAADHIDWHGGFDAYWRDKAKVYAHTQRACIYTDDDTRRMVEDADVQEGARAIGVTSAAPPVAYIGVVDDVIVDRAFTERRHTHAIELATLDDLRHLSTDGTIAPHILTDALTAAALARAYGAEPEAVRDGLREYKLGRHRNEVVSHARGITWIDDSKATNAHAAEASIAAIESGRGIVIVGGLAKGAAFGDLVSAIAPRIKAVVIIGVDRTPWREALAQNAPGIPAIEIEDGDHVMDSAVRAAAGFAQAGDTVILAPASASMDQFTNYAARGDAFAKAVSDLEA